MINCIINQTFVHIPQNGIVFWWELQIDELHFRLLQEGIHFFDGGENNLNFFKHCLHQLFFSLHCVQICFNVSKLFVFRNRLTSEPKNCF